MKNLLKAKPFSIFLAAIILVSLNCAGTAKKETQISEEQKEQDLIKLLNARQDQGLEKTTVAEKETQNVRISELEKESTDSKKEINALKSELLLKEEKIRQLESKQAETKNIEIPAVRQVEKPIEMGSKVVIDDASFTAEYNKAHDAYMAKNYKMAMEMFENLLKNNNKHSLSDNCQYWIGECYDGLEDYKNAILAFEKVFTYLSSNKDDDSQIKLGICYYKLGDMEKAKEEFNKLIYNYPKSEYVGRAKNYLEKIG
jgi:tol-pal system protein YbgF